ncbi:glycerophosphodiester phosphodiesterase [Paenibacillus tarimensis]
MVRIVAHRGCSGKAPENTLAAIGMALAEEEIYSIEIDVHLSKDGVPVVMHDHTLDRTSTGEGLIKEHTYEQLRRLDAGKWFAPEFMGQPIPSLEEVLQLTQGRCRLEVELKKKGTDYEGIEGKVIELIRRYGMQDLAVLSSFDHDSMKIAGGIDPSIETRLIYAGKPTLILEQLQYTRAKSVSMHYAYVTPALVKELQDFGVDVGVWTVDEPEEMKKLVPAHPNLRITTNYPDRLIKVIHEMKQTVR